MSLVLTDSKKSTSMISTPLDSDSSIESSPIINKNHQHHHHHRVTLNSISSLPTPLSLTDLNGLASNSSQKLSMLTSDLSLWKPVAQHQSGLIVYKHYKDKSCFMGVGFIKCHRDRDSLTTRMKRVMEFIKNQNLCK